MSLAQLPLTEMEMGMGMRVGFFSGAQTTTSKDATFPTTHLKWGSSDEDRISSGENISSTSTRRKKSLVFLGKLQFKFI